ncbi:hypothetical protein FKW77_010124 [Venturia effusa]|uniref:ubiquitinyl hydrolase 1 n=1 Tax=Venturia effusa TaxID=50376 RepID=A0A517L4B6_9PEZI|nr:hypothetical protein FKW77_010124 [Venturia effusa]
MSTTIQRLFSTREKKGKSGTNEAKELHNHHHHHRHHASFPRILQSEEKSKRKPDKDEDRKVKELVQRLQTNNPASTNATQAHIETILRLPSINGDVDKAFDMFLALDESASGVLHDYGSKTKLVGAVNRENVTCYLDSLLFSMFAQTDSFEGILTADDDKYDKHPEKKELVMLLRLWVNMLRTGKLITTDITEKLQEALKGCGWPEAALLRQQDVSEAFTFITDALDHPLLTLKMDVYHPGKEDNDDHRIVRERLLDVAIPKPPEDGSVIRLEDCLESYFNNKVEVKRHLQRRNTIQSFRSVDKGQVITTESIESRPGSPASITDSIFSHRRIETGEPSRHQTRDDILLRGSRRRASTVKKEVLMSAWQFFSLIPWPTHEHPSDEHPKNDKQVADHLKAKRPVLGICLKRYSMTNQGVGSRLDTYIDIPLEIGLPHFISDDCGHEDKTFEPNFTNFKLKLLAVICHRGSSLDRGHYISLVRGDADVPSASLVPKKAGLSQVATFAQQSQVTQPSQAADLGKSTQIADSTKPSQVSQSSETTTAADPIQLTPKTSDQQTGSATNARENSSTSSLPDPNEALQESRHNAKEPPWLRFDDLATNRIAYVDIHQALKDEVPYLLFYQVQPIEDDTISELGSPTSERGDPPTYNEAVVEASTDELSRITSSSALTDSSTTTSVVETMPSQDSAVPTADATIATYEVTANNPSLLNVENIGRSNLVGHSNRSDPEIRSPSPVLIVQPQANLSAGNVRPKSLDLSTLPLTAPNLVVRSSVDGSSFQSNQGSLTFTEESHKGEPSAPATPGDETEIKNGLLSTSRRNSMSKGWLKSKSRPNSQSGENRLSIGATLSRLRNSMSKDKLGSAPTPLPVENVVAVPHDGSPESRGSTSLHLETGDAGATHRKSESFGRSKSLRNSGKRKSKTFGKSSTEIGSAEEPKSKTKSRTQSPDRQCAVM